MNSIAITFIYPIKSTPEAALDYSLNNKEFKVDSILKDDVSDNLEYIGKDKIIENVEELIEKVINEEIPYATYDEIGRKIIFKTIRNSLNCSYKNAAKEFEYVRKLYGKDKGNKAYCIIQNFGKDVDPEVANRIGVEFCQEYLKDYQCVVCTHTNTGYIHNHINFNSVSFKDGHKFNDCLKTIQEIRNVSDRMCYENFLPVLEHTKKTNFVKYKDENGKTKFFEPTERKIQEKPYGENKSNYYSNKEFYNLELHKKKSNKDIIKKDIDELLPKVSSFEELLEKLRDKGYEIKAKRKDGTWREFISYKAPGQDKFTRDTEKKLGYNYQRVVIEDIIKNKEKEFYVYKEDIYLESKEFDETGRTRFEEEIKLFEVMKTLKKISISPVNNSSQYKSYIVGQKIRESIMMGLHTMNIIKENNLGSLDDMKNLINKTKKEMEYMNRKIKESKNNDENFNEEWTKTFNEIESRYILYCKCFYNIKNYEMKNFNLIHSENHNVDEIKREEKRQEELERE